MSPSTTNTTLFFAFFETKCPCEPTESAGPNFFFPHVAMISSAGEVSLAFAHGRPVPLQTDGGGGSPSPKHVTNKTYQPARAATGWSSHHVASGAQSRRPAAEATEGPPTDCRRRRPPSIPSVPGRRDRRDRGSTHQHLGGPHRVDATAQTDALRGCRRSRSSGLGRVWVRRAGVRP